MSIPNTVQHTGVVRGSPPSGGALGVQSLQEMMRTDFQGTYSFSKSSRNSINTTIGAPYSFPFESITNVQLFVLRVLSGSLVVRTTSTNGGATQAIPTSGLLILQNTSVGDYFSAIDAYGTADIEYVLAGT